MSVGVAGNRLRWQPALYLGLPALIYVALVVGSLFTVPDRMALTDRLTEPFTFGPSGAFYLFGTDELGRSYLHRIAEGMLFSVSFALLGSALSCCVGLAVSGLYVVRNRIARQIFEQIVYLQISIPYILIIIVISSFLGRSTPVLLLAFAFYGWEMTARTFAEQINQIRDSNLIRSARLFGAGWFDILIRYYLALIAPQIAVVLALNFSKIIVAESTLSFVGLGIQPPQASLGTLLASGHGTFELAWWGVAFPAAAIVICGVWAAAVIARLGGRGRYHYAP